MESEALQERLNDLRMPHEPTGTKASSRATPLILGGVLITAAALVVGFEASRMGISPWPISRVGEATAPKSITVAVADPAPGASELVASGFVVARRRATVAAETTGRLVSLPIEVGMTVTKGQVLAVLDTSLAQVDVTAARAKAAAAAAAAAAIQEDAAEASRVSERTDRLAQREFASAADVSRDRAKATSAAAQLVKARADLAAAQADADRAAVVVARSTIRAPFSGTIVDTNAQPGEIISPISAGGGFTRTGICTIVDLDSLEVEVDVNEAYIAKVYPGQPVSIILDAYPQLTFPGRVIASIPAADRAKGSVRVRIALDSKDRKILPDMAVKAELHSAPAANSTATLAIGGHDAR